MHRRAVILMSAASLACCAAPPKGAGPAARAAASPPSPATPPPPPPPAPPQNTAFLAQPAPPMSPSGDARFDAWRNSIIQAWGEGWRPYLLRLLADLRPVSATSERRPEPLGAGFIREVVTPERITEGKKASRETWLLGIARRYSLPPEVLAAVWGAESDFGRRAGEHDLLAYWATRAAVGDGYREDQFGDTAKLVVDGRIPRSVLRAFADGSTGQVRWFPTQYAAMARDGDGDGVADIWRSPRDALEGVAARLAGAWRPGAWVVEVLLPTGDDPQTRRFLEAVRREAQVRPDYFRRADGQPWSPEETRDSGRLVRPMGPTGPAYLLLSNFSPLQYLAGDYRARFPGEDVSVPWALAIGLLANGIRET